jgi:hypothetical protein
VFSIRYVKNYIKRVTGRLETSKKKGATSEGGFVYMAVQCRRQILRTDRIPQEKELLRTTLEPEQRTGRIRLSFMGCNK